MKKLIALVGLAGVVTSSALAAGLSHSAWTSPETYYRPALPQAAPRLVEWQYAAPSETQLETNLHQPEVGSSTDVIEPGAGDTYVVQLQAGDTQAVETDRTTSSAAEAVASALADTSQDVGDDAAQANALNTGAGDDSFARAARSAGRLSAMGKEGKLPGETEIGVSVDSPAAGDVFVLGDDVTVNGTASIGAGVAAPATLVSVEVTLDGGGPIVPTVNPPLPQDGPAIVQYETTLSGLDPGSHDICATATGTDPDPGSVEDCVTIQVFDLTATPLLAINNLNVDDEHTVTATILGDPAQVAGRTVNFQVTGQNAGDSGTCSPNPDCTTDASGQVSFTYSVPVESASAGTDTIHVSTDIGGQQRSVDVTKDWLLLTADPPEAINELGQDQEHTVTATIWGNPVWVSGILVDFEVLGQNAGATGICSPNPDCTTDAGGQVSFTYSVLLDWHSLGVDTIQVSATFGDQGDTAIVEVTKDWVDTTPPEASCEPGVNPHGKNEPGEVGQEGKGNPDGFYEMAGEDDVWPVDMLEFFVLDTGSGTTFGPFSAGTTIKYTQAPGAPPNAKKMGSDQGQAGAVDWHIIGNGDAAIQAVDGSGNQSDPADALCPVPPKKK